MSTAAGAAEEHVSSRYLETEDGEPVGLNDLHFENKVIWRCKGVPYEVIILHTNSKLGIIIIIIVIIIIIMYYLYFY